MDAPWAEGSHGGRWCADIALSISDKLCEVAQNEVIRGYKKPVKNLATCSDSRIRASIHAFLNKNHIWAMSFENVD